MPDAYWITDYDSYFNCFYQCVPAEEDDEDEKEDDE